MDRLADQVKKNDIEFYHVIFGRPGSTDTSVSSREFLYSMGDSRIYNDLFRNTSKCLVIIDREGRLVYYQSYQSTTKVGSILVNLLKEEVDSK
ncbi:hypothetical protein ACFL6G_08025 [candidate division KSB1 bacterium]